MHFIRIRIMFLFVMVSATLTLSRATEDFNKNKENQGLILTIPNDIIKENILPLLDQKRFYRLRQTSKTFHTILGEKGLQYLDLGDLPDLTNEKFLYAIKATPGIKRLRVPSGFNIFDKAIEGLNNVEIMEFDTPTESFNAQHISGELPNFFWRLPNLYNLKSLHIYNFDKDASKAKIGSAIVVAMINIYRSRFETSNGSENNLTSLTLAYSNALDDIISPILSSLPKLTALNLEGNNITDKGAQQMVNYSSKLMNLKLLDLSGNIGISQPAKEAVIKTFGNGVIF